DVGMTSRASYRGQDRDSRRRSDPIPVPYSREDDNKRDVMIQKYLDEHEPDQIRFPNRTFQDPGPSSNPVESQRDFYDLQGMIDFSRENETAFYYWLDDEPKSSYELQFDHQDKLIRVLDEYLQVREAQIQAQEDSLLGTELALLRTEKDLAQQVEANNDLHEVYHQVVRTGDDQAYYIAQENDYMQFLEGKLMATRTELSQQSETVAVQEDLVTGLQAEIAAYRQRVDELLDERQDLLNDVSDRVTELQRIGDVMVSPGADSRE
ncbi:MAG: hypothetical protein K8I00_11655, partial [Candidatus Omnitrophica bacterium]|nr:hypothetical protein [Candidatus Omnitrophota bacterium]